MGRLNGRMECHGHVDGANAAIVVRAHGECSVCFVDVRSISFSERENDYLRVTCIELANIRICIFYNMPSIPLLKSWADDGVPDHIPSRTQ